MIGYCKDAYWSFVDSRLSHSHTTAYMLICMHTRLVTYAHIGSFFINSRTGTYTYGNDSWIYKNKFQRYIQQGDKPDCDVPHLRSLLTNRELLLIFLIKENHINYWLAFFSLSTVWFLVGWLRVFPLIKVWP